jgi:predicted transcriptional regulator
MGSTSFETQTGKIGGARTPNSAFLIQGADGPVEVPAGQYYFNTRARCARMILNHLSRGARQVHACLELATMNWRREVAMVQEKNGERPLTISDISSQTGLDKADVRRFLDELERNGLAERMAKDGGALRKGAVLIYSWAQPREPKPEKLGVRAPSIPEWIPESWRALRAFANRGRYAIPDDLDEGARTLELEEGERVARNLENAQEEAARYLDSLCARDRPNKEDRHDRQNRPKEPAAAALEAVVMNAAAAAESAPDSTTEEPEPPPIAVVVSQELSIDEDAAERLVSGCREVDKSITGPEIVMLAQAKLLDARDQIRTGKIQNVVGLLINHIPKMCKGATLQAARRQIEEAKQQAAQQLAQRLNSIREMWPDLSGDERAEMLRMYPELKGAPI